MYKQTATTDDNGRARKVNKQLELISLEAKINLKTEINGYE